MDYCTIKRNILYAATNFDQLLLQFAELLKINTQMNVLPGTTNNVILFPWYYLQMFVVTVPFSKDSRSDAMMDYYHVKYEV